MVWIFKFWTVIHILELKCLNEAPKILKRQGNAPIAKDSGMQIMLPNVCSNKAKALKLVTILC